MRPGEHTLAYLVPLLFANGRPTRLWTTANVEIATTGPEWAGNVPVGAIGIDLASGRFLTRFDWSHPALGEGPNWPVPLRTGPSWLA